MIKIEFKKKLLLSTLIFILLIPSSQAVSINGTVLSATGSNTTVNITFDWRGSEFEIGSNYIKADDLNHSHPQRVSSENISFNFTKTDGRFSGLDFPWYSSSSDTSKHIDSNISDHINISVDVTVASCGALQNPIYESHTGIFNKTYSLAEYNCTSDALSLNIIGVENTSTTNILFLAFGSIAMLTSNNTHFPYSTNIRLDMNSTGLDTCNCTINGTNNLGKVVNFNCDKDSQAKFDMPFDGNYTAVCSGIVTVQGTKLSSTVSFVINRLENPTQKASSIFSTMIFLIGITILFAAFTISSSGNYHIAFALFTHLLLIFNLNFASVLLREWGKISTLISLVDTLLVIMIIGFFTHLLLLGIWLLFSLYKKAEQARIDLKKRKVFK